MGSGVSQSTQTEYTRSPPNRSNYHSNGSPTQPSRSHPQSVSTQRNRLPQDNPAWAQPVQQQDWPLPPDGVYSLFQVNDDSDSNRYALTPPSPRDTAASGPSTPRAKALELYNEKDTSNENWKQQIDSKSVESAHVQSQLSSRFHACFNLSASDNIGVVMSSLKKTHEDLDNRLKIRLAKISAEAELKIGLIIDDTRDEQKRLLAYDKEQQLRQDELYQEWLQKYIVELNTWRSRELAKLQEKLVGYQTDIVIVSKQKIDRINQDANLYKTQVLNEEKTTTLKKTDKITSAIYDLTREDAQFLGSESKTEFNLRIQANVGRIAPGQSCTNGIV